jgi:two-component system chemotaxis response regulator CheY
MSTEYSCLLVDDSPIMRQLIMFALARIKNVRVTEASDGIIGMKHLAASTFDLIITDINMPVMDGLKLIGRIRADERHKHVPIIVISTENSVEDRQRAMTLGATAYVQKPIQAPQVIAKVKEVLKISE